MRVAILGVNGLLGDAFRRKFQNPQLLLSRQNIDFVDSEGLSRILKSHQIDTVINCAAVVGGIELNRTKPYDMFSSNISLSESVLKACINSGVSDLVQFCSNCSYPAISNQPYKESTLFDGPSHKLNKGYASAKIASVHSGQCAEDQGLIRVYHPIPCSLFGLNDNYSLANSHFVAAAIRKIYEAKLLNKTNVEFWGTGKPYREFLCADNVPSAIKLLLENKYSYDPINIGTGRDTPIKDVINFLISHSKFKGEVKWDSSKPDGAMHKLLDSALITAMGWKHEYDLFDSLSMTYDFYSHNNNSLRK